MLMVENLLLTDSISTKRQLFLVPNECKICGAPAIYSYFGVISCSPCKMFFKRNAERGPDRASKCKFGGRCKFNLDHRYECSSCRLKKCFVSGMQTEMIRSSHPKPRTKRNRTVNADERTLAMLMRFKQLGQLRPLNLLQADMSTLTVDQWTLISNLSRCYDEHSGLSIGERYMREQDRLPPKLRFKTAPMIMFMETIVNGTQLLYKNNQDFLSLSIGDRSILLHSTSAHTASISSNFIFYKIKLMDRSIYYDSLEMITHSSLIPTAKRMANLLDFDMIVIKLMLGILSFSTTSYTVYSNTSPVNLSNIKHVLHIQDKYVELMWRYLLYKYTFERAVRCCSDLIRCLFVINQAMTEIEKIQWFTDMMDSLVQKTEQILPFHR